jgi:rhodanese-related sulfurtransferase
MTSRNNHTVRNALVILIAAALVGVIANTVSPNGIELVGFWPNVFDSDSVWLSPSYEPGTDAPAISLPVAYDQYLTHKYLFVDAREPEEFEIGHIKGAINFPFEEVDEYWPRVQPFLPLDTAIVVYCAGSECENSLFLARYMKEDLGFTNVEIFFGGWRAWYNDRLPIEGTEGYGDADK